MKNDEGEESRILLENYKTLLQKALDWLWERIKVERREVKRGKKVITKVKITLPETVDPKSYYEK
jgi:putative transposase